MLGRFGVRFVDSTHRFDSLMRFVDSILLNSTARPGGMREAIESAARNAVEGENGVSE